MAPIYFKEDETGDLIHNMFLGPSENGRKLGITIIGSFPAVIAYHENLKNSNAAYLSLTVSV